MRGWHLIPLGLILFAVIALPVAALTNTGLEHEVRTDLGLDTGECEPTINLASPWAAAPSFPVKLDEPRGAVVDGMVFLVGGITGLKHLPNGQLSLEPSNELTRFDPKSETFEERAPLPQRLNHVGVVSYDGDFYVLGGYGRSLSSHTRDTFYRYDPGRDEWSRMPDMPEPRGAMGVGVVGHQLIVAGGTEDNVPKADAFSFDFRTNSWQRLPDMLSKREHVGATVVGDKLYVLGGRTGSLTTNTAEDYDVSERRWTRLPSMPVESGGLGAVNADGEVIAVGGGNDAAGTVTGAVQEWSPQAEEWSLLPEMRTPRHGHAAVSVGDRIWAFGGSPCAYFNATDSVESWQLDRP